MSESTRPGAGDPAADPTPGEGRADEVEVVEERDDAGRLLARSELRGGVLHGLTTAYGENGRPLREERFREGRLDGESVTYDEAGRVREQATFHDGLLDGEMVVRDEAGRVEQRLRFAAGELDGLTEIFNAGTPQARIGLRGGKRHGEMTSFDEQGRPASILRYRDGELDGRAEFLDPRGRCVRTADYVAGALEGEVVDYFPDTGRVRERTPYRGGKPHGERVRYRPDATVEESAVYADGEPVGEPVPHDERGRPLRAVPDAVERRDGGEAGAAEERPPGDVGQGSGPAGSDWF